MRHEKTIQAINIPPVIKGLVEVRLAWGLSRTEVSKRSGIQIRKIRLYELGLCEPNLRFLRKWADALGYEITLGSKS